MDKKLIKEAFVEVAGKIAEPLVDILDEKKYMNEFLIAKKMDMQINQTRNILYRISEHGMVSSTRKKDKKKGWFTYSWRIEGLKSLEFLKGMIVRRMGQINNQIHSRETKEFYVCETCHVEFNEENALIHDFTCPECGSILTLKDNTKLIKEMKKNLDGFQSVLGTVDSEIEKEEAMNARRIKAKDTLERKKKEMLRKEAAAKRAKARAEAKAKEAAEAPKKTKTAKVTSEKKSTNKSSKTLKAASTKSSVKKSSSKAKKTPKSKTSKKSAK